ncbi:MAG: glycosyltransferase family 2 protein [Myxococcales bacterium]
MSGVSQGSAGKRYGLSIVVPVYNGASTIEALVDALAGLTIEGGQEIILVNDGSPDNSAEICRKLTGRKDVPVTFCDLSRNFGEHNAVMAGLSQARGDYVINMDDDLQNPPEEVARLYDYTRQNGLDVVYTYYDKKEHAGWRNLGSWLANRSADLLLDKPRGLYLSSFRCMSAFLVKEVVRHTGPYPYVDGLIMQTTQRIGSLNVKHLPRAVGRSNYTMRKLVRLWLSIFLNFSVAPLRVASVFGLGLAVLGVLAFAAVAYEAVVQGGTPRGWASVMGAVLLLSGAQMLMLGIIGEYLGRLFMTTNARPQYIIRETVQPDAELKSRSAG